MELFFLALMLLFLFAALGSGFPVAFALPGAAILTIAVAAGSGWLTLGDMDAYFGPGGGPDQWISAGVMNIRGIYRDDSGDTLIAIPLFIFMGLMLQRSRVAEDLLLAMAAIFGRVRGGLGISAIVVGALLAATTSVVGATVSAMGMISLPTMLHARYSKPLAAGLTAATGTLGQIIPPSIVLLILVHQLTTAVGQANASRRALYQSATGSFTMPPQFDVPSVSAGEMFMGALIPGLLLVGLYILFVLATAFLRPDMAPEQGRDDDTPDTNRMLRLLLALAPPLGLILLVLGSIVAGIATVNQAGAIGSAGATMMAGYRLYEGRRNAFAPVLLALTGLLVLTIVVNVFDCNLRRLGSGADLDGIVLAALSCAAIASAVIWSTWRVYMIEDTLRAVLWDTMKTTSLVFAILVGVVMLTAAFRSFGGQDLVREFLRSLPGGFWGQFTISMGLVFLLGFFLDFIEITAVVVPIIAPILLADPTVNVTALWLGVMIAINIQTSFLTPPFGFALFYLRGVAPPVVRTTDIYKGVMPFIAIQLVALMLVTAFPRLVTNLPNRVLLQSDTAPPPTNPRLQACLERHIAQSVTVNETDIRDALGDAKRLDLSFLPSTRAAPLNAAFTAVGDGFAAISRIEAAKAAIDAADAGYRPALARIRRLESDIARVDKRFSEATDPDLRSELQRARDALVHQIPSDWQDRHAAFMTLTMELNRARLDFKRLSDTVTAPVHATLDEIASIERVSEIRSKIVGLQAALPSMPASDADVEFRNLRAILRKTPGTAPIADVLSEASKALKDQGADWTQTAVILDKAVDRLDAEITWRQKAKNDLAPGLLRFQSAIADTIGLRAQPRLPKAIATEIADCISSRQDIFLNF